ncbi:MAG: FtsX-like permease family protein [bacterium]|nr:FtsX-like permease family protein [bacterium]
MNILNNTLLKRSSFRYFIRHKWQIGLSIIGIVMGVAVVVSVDLANQGARSAFELSLEGIAGKATHHIVGGPAGIPDSVYRSLRIDSGFRQSAPVIEKYISTNINTPQTMLLLGIDPFAERLFRPYLANIFNRTAGNLADFFTQPGSALISKPMMDRLDGSIKDSLLIRNGRILRQVRIIGTIEPQDERSRRAMENLIITDISTAQELLDMNGHLSRIDLIIDNNPAGAENLEKIKSMLPSGIRIARSEMRSRTAAQMVSAFNLNLTALSLLALIVGMFLIYNTMTFSVVQRRSYIGLIRSIGVTRHEIFRLILNEALMLGVIGTMLGIITGIVLGKGMIRLVTQSINDLYFVLSVNSLEISVVSLVKGFAIGIGATLIAAFKPAREATDSPPRVVLSRSIQETDLKEKIPQLSLYGIILTIIGIVVLWLPGYKIMVSYAGIVPLVLGLALLTPLVIFSLVRMINPVAGKLFGILGRMSTRGVVTQISRTAVAIAALSIAVATTIGVGTMIGSFRNTVVNWLENILSADIYIAAPRLIATQAYGDLDPSFADRIAQLPQVQYVNYYRENQIETEAGKVILFTAKIGEHRYHNFSFKSGNPKQIWQAYQTAEAAIVSEPYAYRNKIKIGDSIALPTDKGKRKFNIAGIYYDYGTDVGLVSIAHHTYRKYWNDDKLSGILVYAYQGTDIDRLMGSIRQMTSPDEEVIIQSNKSLLNVSIDVFDRTFLITKVLQTLAIFVAFVGVLSALMAIQLERNREFGVLRATGLTPGQLWKLVILQTGIMGLISGVFALPIGNILALVLIRVINERSFGWTIHFEFMPHLFLQAIALAIFAAILAGIYPAYKMARTSPALALREE